LVEISWYWEKFMMSHYHWKQNSPITSKIHHHILQSVRSKFLLVHAHFDDKSTTGVHGQRARFLPNSKILLTIGVVLQQHLQSNILAVICMSILCSNPLCFYYLLFCCVSL
jgi:hypothetical protein